MGAKSNTVHTKHTLLLHAREVQGLLARNNNRNYVLIDLLVTLYPSHYHVLVISPLLAYTDVTLKARRVPESSSIQIMDSCLCWDEPL